MADPTVEQTRLEFAEALKREAEARVALGRQIDNLRVDIADLAFRIGLAIGALEKRMPR